MRINTTSDVRMNPCTTNAREIYGAKWSEKEYLIALDAYFKHKGEAQHADTGFILELSRILGRTPHSILYRLQNYASIDPQEKEPRRKGKIHLTEIGKRIFEEWAKKKDTLTDTAQAFLRDEKSKMEPDLFNPAPVRLPIKFRNYELLDEIGRGGFGVVLSCLNTRNSRVYAIKVIDGSKIHEKDCVGRFAREIKALKAVKCPGIIKIYDDNLDDEKTYPGFVMDLAECDLSEYIANQAITSKPQGKRPILNNDEAVHIFNSVINAIEFLHNSHPSILHRDINPTNILRLFDESWVLADFSLAKFVDPRPVSTSFVTATHVGMGTAHYTAPEQYNCLKAAEIRSDIYSLGWLLWELFSSNGPYPERIPSGLPHKLETVFHKATSRLKEDRFLSIAEMKKAFNDCW